MIVVTIAAGESVKPEAVAEQLEQAGNLGRGGHPNFIEPDHAFEISIALDSPDVYYTIHSIAL